MVNKGSHFADFVRLRTHTYNLHAHSTISALWAAKNTESNRGLPKLKFLVLFSEI